MAIEVFSDNPSPRISFSHDLGKSGVVPVERYVRSNSSSASDFDFCVFQESLDHDSSSADELFSGGKMLPIGIQKRLPLPMLVQDPPREFQNSTKTTSFTEEKKMPSSNSEENQQNSKPSFWSFKRSASLNCGGGYGRTLCPFPTLSRSNSTGSSARPKRAPVSNNQKSKGYAKQPLFVSPAANQQRPPLRKSSSYFKSGMKVNPVLNVSNVSLFALGFIFSSAKDKEKKKR